MNELNDKIIVALDVNNKESFLKLCLDLQGKATFIKIGMECFYSLGEDSVRMAKDAGLKVFLDLKLHDIPNTVEKSMYSLTRLGADIINVHALGGLEMMKAAKRGVNKAVEQMGLSTRPKVIAVTHLTSLDQRNLENELGIKEELKKSALNLAKLAKDAGLDGVVCSAHEAMDIKNNCGSDFLTVTPGIRLSTDNTQDQKRVMTPKLAVESGSDCLVVGRSITASPNPKETFDNIIQEIS